jgi:hypothetical protein
MYLLRVHIENIIRQDVCIVMKGCYKNIINEVENVC